MAQAVEQHWPGPLSGLGGDSLRLRRAAASRIEIVEAAHPVPDAAGHAGGRAHARAGAEPWVADDLVLCLISGGGSALLPLPAPGLTLELKQTTGTRAARLGRDHQRIQLRAPPSVGIKGGRLGAACHPARVLTLLMSDVPGDRPIDIASGPDGRGSDHVRGRAATFCGAMRSTCRRAVRELLESGRGESVKPGDARLAGAEVRMIATPQMALEAAAALARSAGYAPHILGDAIEGEARDVGTAFAGIAAHVADRAQPFAAPVRAPVGRRDHRDRARQGPRRTQRRISAGARRRARRARAHLRHRGRHRRRRWPGGDRRRGDRARIRSRGRGSWGLRPKDVLANNDAHTFFQALGDSVITGPTLTNVNDFRAILIEATR